MAGDPFAEFDALVRELEKARARQTGQPRTPPRRDGWRSLRRWLLRGAALASALLLPFYLLVGGSVLFYRLLGLPTWPALLAGVLLTALLLLLYAYAVAKRVSGRFRLPRPVRRATLAVVGAYCLYTLLYLSSLNVKDAAILDEYRSLHPLLRLATSTFILVDSDLVITDMQRAVEEYEWMGLAPYERSLHRIQADGYAHAVDLRTIGRRPWRNLLLEGYFTAMGFRTLRHVGTADHLHVSLPNP
ncbi:MAG: hypothetical protein JSU87_15035 [Gemmatimonadota bacterium]|nr:MAG: hypothetical protein JSU87_15035 [Gemmatimonadota bacterium]